MGGRGDSKLDMKIGRETEMSVTRILLVLTGCVAALLGQFVVCAVLVVIWALAFLLDPL